MNRKMTRLARGVTCAAGSGLMSQCTSSARSEAAANQPKELEVVPGFGHDVLFEETTWAREVEFFTRVIKR